jgi:hypothetical protein
VIALLSLVALALALSNATTATAVEPKTEVKSVPVELVFENKQDPGDPGHCAANVFFKWQDVPYTLSAIVHYTYKGEDRTVSGTPPFDDHYSFVTDFNVPVGSHWLAGPPSWKDGPIANDCSSSRVVYEERYTQPAHADLTLEVQAPPAPTIDPKVCNEANAKLKQRNKAVSKLLGKLRKASGKKAKNDIRTKLAKAKRSRAKAVQQVAAQGC